MYDVNQGCEPEYLTEVPDRSEVIEVLGKYIKSLPADERASEAISIASQLVELTAFDIAGLVDSARVGALIECAAKLCDPDIQEYDTMQRDATATKDTVQ